MKARCLSVLAFCLIVLCLGSGRGAQASSVTGGGIVSSDQGSLVFSVTARSDSRGVRGVVQVVSEHNHLLANVVDLCVQGNQATVISQVIQSNTSVAPVGTLYVLLLEDNGTTGDRVFNWAGAPSFPCFLFFLLVPNPIGMPLDGGNITITP